MVEEGEQVKPANPSSTDHDNQSNIHLLNEKSAFRKGKSCKGCLYYSSTLKSKSRNPVCVGITRSLPKGILLFNFIRYVSNNLICDC